MGDKIKLKLEYFQVPNEIFDLNIEIEVNERKKVKGSKETVVVKRPLKAYEKLIYIYLCRCGNQGSQAFPSYNTIAKQCGIGRNTAIECVRNLTKNGLLEKKPRKKQGSDEDNSNIYFILKPREKQPPSPQSVPPSPQSVPPSPPGAPKKELYKKNYIKKELYKYTEDFLEWYDLYPNTWDKQQSFKNFTKLLKKETFENIMLATKNYIAYIKANKVIKKYITRSTNFVGEKQIYHGYLKIDLDSNDENNSLKTIEDWGK